MYVLGISVSEGLICLPELGCCVGTKGMSVLESSDAADNVSKSDDGEGGSRKRTVFCFVFGLDEGESVSSWNRTFFFEEAGEFDRDGKLGSEAPKDNAGDGAGSAAVGGAVTGVPFVGFVGSGSRAGSGGLGGSGCASAENRH